MENLKGFKQPRFPSFRLHKISTLMRSRLHLFHYMVTHTPIIIISAKIATFFFDILLFLFSLHTQLRNKWDTKHQIFSQGCLRLRQREREIRSLITPKHKETRICNFYLSFKISNFIMQI